jgi:Zn ribbon nucleic-acid-binding protein
MLASCPSCSARNHLSAREAQGLTLAECRSCGHRWREMEVIEAIDVTEIQTSRVPAIMTHDEAPDRESRRLVELAREAQEVFAAQRQARSRRLRNWGIFAAFLLAPLVPAIAMPDLVVKAAPITEKYYEALGYDINLYGLEIRRVERQHAVIDDKRILSIRGEVSNIDDKTRKIPHLHFTLVGPSGEALYTWTLDTASRPLRSGETTGFVTRVAAPPEAAENLKIRFARSNEIGVDQGITASTTPVSKTE